MYHAKKQRRPRLRVLRREDEREVLAASTDREQPSSGEGERTSFTSTISRSATRVRGASRRSRALVRWVDDGMVRFVGPDEFIPIAEETGLIVDIGAWVLRTACAQAADWRARGFEDLRLSVNLSVCPAARHRPRRDAVEQKRYETGSLPADALELEITETLDPRLESPEHHGFGREAHRSWASASPSTISAPATPRSRPSSAFRSIGIKIDRSFVAGVGTNPKRRGARVGDRRPRPRGSTLKVVAEGVEDRGAGPVS